MSRVLVFAVTVALVVTTVPAVLADDTPRADAGKRSAELPAETAVRDSRSGRVEQPGQLDLRVAPGAVRWHGDLATARATSRRSGRPVLLFQLLGRLDEEFC